MKEGIYFIIAAIAGALASTYDLLQGEYGFTGLAVLLGGVLVIAGIGMIAARSS